MLWLIPPPNHTHEATLKTTATTETGEWKVTLWEEETQQLGGGEGNGVCVKMFEIYFIHPLTCRIKKINTRSNLSKERFILANTLR